MKKILFAVMAMVAIGMTSCGNKTQQGEAADSTAVEQVAGDEDAQSTIDQLSALIKEGDATKLQEALESVKAKIAELIKQNPDAAKEYVAKVQTFLKENVDKIKGVAGDNAAVQAAVSALTDADPESVVNGLLQQVGETANAAADSVKGAAKQAVDNAKEAAKQKADDAKDAAKEKAAGAIDDAAAAAKKKLGL